MADLEDVPTMRIQMKSKTLLYWLVPAILLMVLGTSIVSAKDRNGDPSSEAMGGFKLPAAKYRGPLHILHSDLFSYEDQSGIVHGHGNVVLSYGNDTLEADEVFYNSKLKTFRAEGNLVYTFVPEAGGTTYKMKAYAVEYNLDSEEGVIYGARTYIDPLYIRATVARQLSRDMQVVKEGTFTTCGLEHPHYYFKAKTLTLYKDKMIAKDIVFYVGNTPVAWWPRYSRKFDDKDSRFDWEVGRSSRLGPYVKAQYKLWADDTLRFIPKLDYYSEQGFAYGIGLQYDYGSTLRGDMDSFYIREKETDWERYRIAARHRSALKYDLNVILFSEYPSDPKVYEDYLDINNRGRIDTREALAAVEKWDEEYILRLSLRRYDEWVEDPLKKRGGSFEALEESAPKFAGILKYQQVGGLPFYYTTQGSISHVRYPENGFPSDSSPMVNTSQLDWDQTLTASYPLTEKMTFVPSLSLYNTWSDKTSVIVDDSDFDTFLEAKLRLQNRINRFTRLDLYYVAEKQIDSNEEEGGDNLYNHLIGARIRYRHPNNRLNVRWRSELSVLPEDDIRTDDRQYYSRLEMTWKATTTLDLGLTNILARGKRFDTLNGNYFHSYQSFLASAIYHPSDRWSGYMVLYYKLNQTPDFAGGNYDEASLYPGVAFYVGKKWKVDTRVNYNISRGRLEEVRTDIIRDLHCWEAYITLRHTEDDDSIRFAMRLKAMNPKATFAQDVRDPL